MIAIPPPPCRGYTLDQARLLAAHYLDRSNPRDSYLISTVATIITGIGPAAATARRDAATPHQAETGAWCYLVAAAFREQLAG